MFSITSTAIAVHPGSPYRTLKELIAAAKANPGKLSYAHAGVGSISHVAGEMFKQLAGGLDILPVPYKGMGPAQMDVVNGTVSMFVPNITGAVIGLHTGGKIRILAVNAPTRHHGMPDVPTAIEAGLPGMITQNFFGIYRARRNVEGGARSGQRSDAAGARRQGFPATAEQSGVRSGPGARPRQIQGLRGRGIHALAEGRGRGQDTGVMKATCGWQRG